MGPLRDGGSDVSVGRVYGCMGYVGGRGEKGWRGGEIGEGEGKVELEGSEKGRREKVGWREGVRRGEREWCRESGESMWRGG